MAEFIDLTNRKFNMLTVKERVSNSKQGKARWKCLCKCGNYCIVESSKLLNETTKSCGCYRKSRIGDESRKHGKTRTKIYKTWCHIKQRCFDKNDTRYNDWGGRGITICDEWKDDFQAFCDYVSKLENFGKVGYSIDRINNDGNYEPGNVRWVTKIVQNNNTRRNHYLTYNGKTQTIAQWAEELGINPYMVYSRINKYHWSVKDALTIPSKRAR